ncbi:MAG: hypothetical protein QM642_02990, partial [Edaphocola sp.]
MTRKYSKREFLKIMGLGIAFVPFVGCFDSDDKKKKAVTTGSLSPAGEEVEKQSPPVTDADVVMLLRNDERQPLQAICKVDPAEHQLCV